MEHDFQSNLVLHEPPELTDEQKLILEKQNSRMVTAFTANKLEVQACKNWNLFYKRNETRFFKDRWVKSKYNWFSSETYRNMNLGYGRHANLKNLLGSMMMGTMKRSFLRLDAAWVTSFFRSSPMDTSFLSTHATSANARSSWLKKMRCMTRQGWRRSPVISQATQYSMRSRRNPSISSPWSSCYQRFIQRNSNKSPTLCSSFWNLVACYCSETTDNMTWRSFDSSRVTKSPITSTSDKMARGRIFSRWTKSKRWWKQPALKPFRTTSSSDEQLTKKKTSTFSDGSCRENIKNHEVSSKENLTFGILPRVS